MGKRENIKYSLISRRDFLDFMAKGIVGTSLVFSEPFLTREISDLYLNASVLEWRNKNSSMGYRRLGKTNIMVSEISFGCGINYGCNAVGYELSETVRGLYDKAFEVGINFFDTAPSPNSGYTREECFQHFRPVRDKVFLSTKVDNFEPSAVRASIERSLKRMKTEYIDIVFLHNVKNRGGWAKGAPALEEIRKMIEEGKVRFGGVSDHSYNNLMQINSYKDLVDVILLKYSMRKRMKAEAVLSKANSLDIGTIGMKVFGGAYKCWEGKVDHWENEMPLKLLFSGSSSVSQAAVSFVLNNKNLSSALIGMRTPAEIIENAKVSIV